MSHEPPLPDGVSPWKSPPCKCGHPLNIHCVNGQYDGGCMARKCECRAFEMAPLEHTPVKPACPAVSTPPKHNPMAHPQHYTSHPSGVECIQITEHLNFCLGNAIKYIWRAGLKSPNAIEDLKKARWYVEREIARLEGAGSK
jgi:hypothetical protein